MAGGSSSKLPKQTLLMKWEIELTLSINLLVQASCALKYKLNILQHRPTLVDSLSIFLQDNLINKYK